MPESPPIPKGWQPLLWAVELDRRADASEELVKQIRDLAAAIRDAHRVEPKRELASE